MWLTLRDLMDNQKQPKIPPQDLLDGLQVAYNVGIRGHEVVRKTFNSLPLGAWKNAKA